jgi:hypothetical protein
MPRDPYQSNARFLFSTVVLAISALALAGCGSGSPFKYVPVKGKVSYNDGTPVPVGQLQFQSLMHTDGPVRPRPAAAVLNSDGSFDCVTSHTYGDGLVPGKHKVVFIFANDTQGRQLVPNEYLSVATTPLEIDTADSPLDIKVPKPKGNR